MNTKDCLRRSNSTRFVRTNHNSSLATEIFDPDIARFFATAAASKAMSRSVKRTSILSEGSYDRLGGPRRVAVPPRRYKRSESCYSSGHSSAGDDAPLQEHDQAWSAALPSISEFGGLEDRISSLPSSYRRLRKSRSMFSTRQRASYISHGPPSSASHSPNIATQGSAAEPPRLYRTLRRSMSFLRGEHQPQNTLRHARSHDVAIQLARSQYEQSFVNSPESPHWAPLPVSKTRREHKPFRKTFRTSDTSERTSATSSPLDRIRATESRGKARAFSSSIKKGIKRVLGFSRTTSENENENKNVEISPFHSQYWSQSPSTVIRNENYYPHPGAMSHVNDRESAGHDQIPTMRRMQSSASLATSRSRVTSWADSTAANTIAPPNPGGQHRLSIVSEQGHFCQADLEPFSQSSIKQPPSNAVDSQRLFSALMKRIVGAHPSSPNEEVVLGHVKEHRAIPTQGSLHFYRSRHTIRQVPSDCSINSPKSFATANVNPPTPYERIQTHDAANIHESISGSRINENHAAKADERQRAGSDSPSVYSRTASDNSPLTKADTDSPDSQAEPGVATIFASERTTYSSPNKSTQDPDDQAPAQAGVDWKNFMESEIAKMENAIPRRHHYREDAQFLDDYEFSFSNAIPARKVHVESRGTSQIGDDRAALNRRVSTSSNFSRPFSRSSSLRTVVKIQEPQINASSTPISLATSDDIFRDSSGHETYLKPAPAGQMELGLSPMLSRSSNKPQMPESPTPKGHLAEVSPKMSCGKFAQYSTKWSPGSQEARILRKGRSTRFHRENRKATNENAKLDQGVYDQSYGLQSPMSSKRMVEIFLNSRRRQMGADLSDDGASEPAFL
ncbi:hypothetical protein BJY01DRAFT_76348 [Aspergillus pseudoustus]|uniref:Uncharacterized protein n=1 Tax=Aspergillus pseudoustus TaxID=1810923 RepID=A0ABR4J658_9EURO